MKHSDFYVPRYVGQYPNSVQLCLSFLPQLTRSLQPDCYAAEVGKFDCLFNVDVGYVKRSFVFVDHGRCGTARHSKGPLVGGLDPSYAVLFCGRVPIIIWK